MQLIPGVIASSRLTVSGAYESIASASGTGSSGVISFSAIPGTYQHLQIRGLAKNTSTGTGIFSHQITANGVGGTSYARHLLRGDGSATGAAGGASQANIDTYGGIATNNSSYTNTTGVIIIDIHDYASTTKNKTFRIFAGVDLNGSGTVELTSGLFVSTSAITSITLTTTNNWTTQTQFALYGIKGA
jgi:hypothetical protein